MLVRDLIAALTALDPDLEVHVWDPFKDEESSVVVVNADENSVLICKQDFGA